MPDAVREAALRFHASVTDAMNAAADDAKVRASTSYDGVAVDGSYYAIAVMVITPDAPLGTSMKVRLDVWSSQLAAIFQRFTASRRSTKDATKTAELGGEG